MVFIPLCTHAAAKGSTVPRCAVEESLLQRIASQLRIEPAAIVDAQWAEL
jgi:hypothetical protein